jgi:hypothetical protein
LKVITALAINAENNKCVVVETNTVHLWHFPDFSENDSYLIRRSLPIRHIELTNVGSHIVVGGDEPDITITSLEKPYKVDLNISTHGIGVKAFCLNKDNNLICFVDGSSNVTINSLTSERSVSDGKYRFLETNYEHRISAVTDKGVCVNKAIGCRIHFHPIHPALVVIPSEEGSFTLVYKYNGGWKEQYVLSDETSHSKKNPLNLAQFSSCGTFLATADTGGIVVVWSVRLLHDDEADKDEDEADNDADNVEMDEEGLELEAAANSKLCAPTSGPAASANRTIALAKSSSEVPPPPNAPPPPLPKPVPVPLPLKLPPTLPDLTKSVVLSLPSLSSPSKRSSELPWSAADFEDEEPPALDLDSEPT